ncbi:TIGR02281 family clan AA aspartic protease [Novosphingobium sp. 9]|uniref:retropepsin-like aspartic protease family protein n=1 Tax=Novosphingobium sp. 9 TaxID=2025349 RepID=UPI0021B5353B|nr:TIGR02281 family clan AA aspartic protease [Novosphingobium sp. 9]
MNLGELGAQLYANPLLALAVVAVLAGIASMMLSPERTRLAQGLRNGAYLIMAAVVLLTIAESALNNDKSEAADWFDHTRPATVSGDETQIAKRRDGHFWVEAKLNGVPTAFLIDTGATYTSISQSVAQAAGIIVNPDSEGRMLDTANGTIVARMSTAGSLDFGGVSARELPVAVTPDSAGDTSVIGMNLLSRLKGWRVDGDRMTLVPSAGATSRPVSVEKAGTN